MFGMDLIVTATSTAMALICTVLWVARPEAMPLLVIPILVAFFGFVFRLFRRLGRSGLFGLLLFEVPAVAVGPAAPAAFSLANMSASDGAADFTGAVFVFEAIFVFVVGWLVHAAAISRRETSARIFFMTRGLLQMQILIKRVTCFYAKTGSIVKEKTMMSALLPPFY